MESKGAKSNTNTQRHTYTAVRSLTHSLCQNQQPAESAHTPAELQEGFFCAVSSGACVRVLFVPATASQPSSRPASHARGRKMEKMRVCFSSASLSVFRAAKKKAGSGDLPPAADSLHLFFKGRSLSVSSSTVYLLLAVLGSRRLERHVALAGAFWEVE